jgi:hypothetical protein
MASKYERIVTSYTPNIPNPITLEAGNYYDLRINDLDALDIGKMEYLLYRHAQVVFVKEVNSLIVKEIIEKAKEHGITDLYVLNEDFIIAAIREKMEQEGKS